MLGYGLYSIPVSDPLEIFSALSEKKYLPNLVFFEARLFSVKKAGSLAKFSSWFTLELDVVPLYLQLHCKWDPSAAQLRGKTVLLFYFLELL